MNHHWKRLGLGSLPIAAIALSTILMASGGKVMATIVLALLVAALAYLFGAAIEVLMDPLGEKRRG